MKKQIVHISVHQTSKVIAAMHTAMITILLILPTVLGYWFHKQFISGFLILIFVPLFIWLMMYIGYVIACWFYNRVVPWSGGIEVEVVDMDVQPNLILKPVPVESQVNSNQMDVRPDEKGTRL